MRRNANLDPNSRAIQDERNAAARAERQRRHEAESSLASALAGARIVDVLDAVEKVWGPRGLEIFEHEVRDRRHIIRCERCGARIKVGALNKRFCSNACRQKAYRSRVTAGSES